MTHEPIELAQFRKCPACGGWARAAATKCALCWARLTPLPEGHPGIETRPVLSRTSGRDISEEVRFTGTPRRGCPRCGHSIAAGVNMCACCRTDVPPQPVANQPSPRRASTTASAMGAGPPTP